MREKIDDESGVVMIEATYCITVCIIVAMFFISFGFYLYQNSTMGIVANEVAEETALTYKYKDAASSSNITLRDIKSVGKFRYMFFSGSFHTRSEERANNIVDQRLTKTALAHINGSPTVKVEVVADTIGRNHYKVTISQRYHFLFADMLKWVGINPYAEISAASYSAGVDVLSYTNTVRNTQFVCDYISDNSTIVKVVNSAIKLIHTICEF